MKMLKMVALLMSMVSIAYADGNGVGGGGERYAAHLVSVANAAYHALRMICSDPEAIRDEKLCASLPALKTALERTKVVPQDIGKPVLGPDGKPRDAINNGFDKITLDTERWKNMREDKQRFHDQVRIALHEHYGTAKVETSDDYRITDISVNLLEKNNFDFRKIISVFSEKDKEVDALLNLSDNTLFMKVQEGEISNCRLLVTRSTGGATVTYIILVNEKPYGPPPQSYFLHAENKAKTNALNILREAIADKLCRNTDTTALSNVKQEWLSLSNQRLFMEASAMNHKIGRCRIEQFGSVITSIRYLVSIDKDMIYGEMVSYNYSSTNTENEKIAKEKIVRTLKNAIEDGSCDPIAKSPGIIIKEQRNSEEQNKSDAR